MGKQWKQCQTLFRGIDGWMASLTRWTWVWVNSGSWWWTGRPGVLRFMGSQRVRHNWATELNWEAGQVVWYSHLFQNFPQFLDCDPHSQRLWHSQFSSVQFSRSVVSNSLRPHESQHARPPCPSPTPRVHSDSCPWSQWCHWGLMKSNIPKYLVFWHPHCLSELII